MTLAHWFSDDDLYLFAEGSHLTLYEKLGAHPARDAQAQDGYHFAVWAPNASRVSVIGEFNQWDDERHPMEKVATSGIWALFVPGLEAGASYKYRVHSHFDEQKGDKSDPFAFSSQLPPETASVLWRGSHDWDDDDWMKQRARADHRDAPMSIYEVHIGSWRRGADGRHLTYRELAHELADHVRDMGFTHVELMPVMEHPFYGSWGYQVTGHFCPSSRYGPPEDFMYMVDYLHRCGIGVILDWVPSHFPTDGHGLGYFDGTHLYEHADPRQGFHPDWKSFIYNYGRGEVCSFLLSNAHYWLDRFHVDGLRVDAVASMLYLDYSRDDGQWVANEHGGRENLESIAFLRRLNEEVYSRFPGIQTIAEESTAWPMVSKPPYIGGLGFGMKWDMGWMHDTLHYMALDPIHRNFHHQSLTFRGMYAFSENFVLPLSHDEVVHGKGSLLAKMAGAGVDQFANLRLLYAYMHALPGKKLLFMGSEIAPWSEWNHDDQLPWDLLFHPPHRGVQKLVRDLNRIHAEEPAMHEQDFQPHGFAWIDCNDHEQSVLSLVRRGTSDDDLIFAIFNFTPVARFDYRVGVPRGGQWTEILNTDSDRYAGGGMGNLGSVRSEPVPKHDQDHSLSLTLPGLTALYFKAEPLPVDAQKARAEAEEELADDPGREIDGDPEDTELVARAQ